MVSLLCSRMFTQSVIRTACIVTYPVCIEIYECLVNSKSITSEEQLQIIHKSIGAIVNQTESHSSLFVLECLSRSSDRFVNLGGCHCYLHKANINLEHSEHKNLLVLFKSICSYIQKHFQFWISIIKAKPLSGYVTLWKRCYSLFLKLKILDTSYKWNFIFDLLKEPNEAFKLNLIV